MNKKCSFENCGKKLKLYDDRSCRCGLLFCSTHRYAEEHNCTYNYKEEHKKKLEKENPKIIAEKINKI